MAAMAPPSPSISGDQTNKGPNFTKTTNEWYMLSGYTDWRGKGMFLDTQLSFGYGNLNGRRSLQLERHLRQCRSDAQGLSKRAGLLLAGGVSTGAVFTYGGTVLTPQVSLDGLTMREEGYTETGGGDGMNLRVQPYYANSMRGYVGTTVRQDIDLGGWFIQPEGRVGYRYDFLADPVKLKAAFASVGNQFTLTGPGSGARHCRGRRQPRRHHGRLVARPELRLSARQQRFGHADRHAHAGRPYLGLRAISTNFATSASGVAKDVTSRTSVRPSLLGTQS